MSSQLLRAVTWAYRRGVLPPRGYGRLFDRIPTRLWGGDVVKVRTDVGHMQLPLSDYGSRQLIIFGHVPNEVAETNLLRALASRITCSLDVGANVGWYTRILAGGGGQVLAFEPDPRIYPLLCTNTQEFESVEAVPVAVGDVDGVAQLYAADRSDLSSTTRAVGPALEVKAGTLDTLVATKRIAPDFVKCDVEGGEIEVLRGARHLRSGAEAPVWMIEADERFFAEQGMTYETLEEEIGSTGDTVRKFWVDRSGHWSPLKHFVDMRGTGRVNVLLVPDQRIDLLDGLLR